MQSLKNLIGKIGNPIPPLLWSNEDNEKLHGKEEQKTTSKDFTLKKISKGDSAFVTNFNEVLEVGANIASHSEISTRNSPTETPTSQLIGDTVNTVVQEEGHESKSRAHSPSERLFHPHVNKRAALWNAMIGKCDPNELETNLYEMSQLLTSEYDTSKLPADYFDKVFSSRVPLLQISSKLLSMIQHLQNWDGFIMELSHHAKTFKKALDSKTLLILLQFYLPTGRARQIYERFVNMGKAVPFIALVPVDRSWYEDEEMCVMLTNFRNLFDISEQMVSNRPFLLSCGTSKAAGKSKFLNLAFRSNFAVNSQSFFHHPSVDATVSTKMNPLQFHVLDYHGTADPTIVRCLASFCSQILLHVSADEAVNNDIDEIGNLLRALTHTNNAIVLIRDASDITNESFKAKISQASDFKNISFVNVPEIQDGEHFTMEFNSILKNEFTAALNRNEKIPNQCETYDAMETVATNSFRNVCNVKTRTEECVALSKHMHDGLMNLSHKNVSNTLFPRTLIHNNMMQVENKLKTSTEFVDSEDDKRAIDADLRLILDGLAKEMKNKTEFHPLLKSFIQVIETEEIALYEEFVAVIRSSNRHGLYLSMEQFWREVMLHLKEMSMEKRGHVIFFAKLILKWGYPIEVLNGDSLTIIDLEGMTDILEDSNNGLLVCSVIGPQSSAKSTLMNYLFGSSFQVSAGRCTKGMHLSLFDAGNYGVENLKRLAVLDTEGLMSATARNSAFDKKMALMALALSNVVLINIRGEVGSDMRHVLEVTLLGLEKLKVIHAHPTLLFVLRDMIDLDTGKQQEAIQRIRTEMKNICEITQSKFEELTEHSFVLLPSAIQETNWECHFLDGNAFIPNPSFSLRIGNLLKRICEFHQIKGANNNVAIPFPNLQEWIQHFNATWSSVRHSGQLLHYKCLQEYFDRQRLSKLTTEICGKFERNFLDECKRIGANIINEQSHGVDLEPEDMKFQFRKKLETLVLPEYLEVANDEFSRDVAGRNFAEGVDREYKNCILVKARVLTENALRDFDYRVEFKVVEMYSRVGLDKIKEWIDENATTKCIENDVDEKLFQDKFDQFWSSERKKLEDQLSSLRASRNKNWSELRNIFSATLNLRPELGSFSASFAEEMAVKEFLRLQSEGQNGKISDELLSRYVVITHHLPSYREAFMSKLLRKDVVRETFKKAVLRLSACISSISNNFKTLNSVEQDIVEIFNIIQTKNELLHRYGGRFTAEFYSICFSNFFHSILQRIEILQQEQIQESVTEFDKHKPALQRSFLYFLRGRFDDAQSASGIVELILEKIKKSVAQTIDQQYLNEIEISCVMTTERLSQTCEQKKEENDVFQYITDCPGFMKSLFREHFRAEEQQLEPSVEKRFLEALNGRTVSLLRCIEKWKNKVMHSPFGQQVADFWKSDTSEDSAKLGRLLFLSFIRYLSKENQEKPILENLQLFEAVQNIFEMLNQEKPEENFEDLFAAVPNSFAICQPSEFCSQLKSNLISKIRAINKYQPNRHLLDRTCERLMQEAVGCMSICPLCKAKCTENNPGHTYHKTEAHRMTAFAGWHPIGTRDFSFRICTSLESRGKKYRFHPTEDEEKYVSFDELMEHHKWKVPLVDNVQIEINNIYRWLQVKERLCEYYDLDDNTPEEWVKMRDGVCPICLSHWDDPSCGVKKQLHCNHFIGSHCYGRLLATPVDQHKCPICRSSL